MWEATPLARAGPDAEDLSRGNTVAWSDMPSVATYCCAIAAGGSGDPARADPSQSSTARLACSTTSAGKSE